MFWMCVAWSDLNFHFVVKWQIKYLDILKIHCLSMRSPTTHINNFYWQDDSHNNYSRQNALSHERKHVNLGHLPTRLMLTVSQKKKKIHNSNKRTELNIYPPTNRLLNKQLLKSLLIRQIYCFGTWKACT